KYNNFGGATIYLFNAKEYKQAIKNALIENKNIFILQE
ncbi:acetyltransferase, partial [Campylobacter jejuni]|nr:acetyltransferase [Campylobacter jejuni]